MLLTAANLFYYLHQGGLITPGALVAGDFCVVPGGSRHRTFAVPREQGPGYFVKQVKQWEPDTGQTLQTEAGWLRAATDDPLLAPLGSYVPRFYAYDPGSRVLVVEWLAGTPLSLHIARQGKLNLELAAELGTALGTLQTRLAAGWPGGHPPAHFVPIRLWVLNEAGLPTGSSTQSPGQAEVLAALRRYPSFATRLADLRATWEPTMLIHADLKWDNWLLCRPALKIVDWEFAGIGDPAWDAGTLAQTFLTWWVGNAANPEAIEPDPPAQTQAAIRAFWTAYIAARGLNSVAARHLLDRTIICAAARLIQTAYESMYHSTQLSTIAVRLLQLSLNILEDPQAAIHELWGSPAA